MSAHIASAMSDCKELMLTIAPYLIPSQDLNKVDHVDHVLGHHGKEGRKVDHEVGEAYTGDTVTATNTYHKAVEFRIILF